MASLSDLDRLREKHPDLAIGVYALEPGGPVTLEIITPDQEVFSWRAATLAGCIARAFPDEVRAAGVGARGEAGAEGGATPEPPAVDVFG